MARIKIKPVEPLELEFQDGTTKIALFNNIAFATFEEEFGSLEKLALEEGQNKPFDFVAKILYCGIKVTEPNFEYSDALNIVYMGGVDLLSVVLESVFQNATAGMDEGKKENFYKEVNSRMERIMNNQV